jgi:hypothetical protein
MSPEEQFERDYEQGRRAGLYDALEFIYNIIRELPKDQRYLIHDLIWEPLHEELKVRNAEARAAVTR